MPSASKWIVGYLSEKQPNLFSKEALQELYKEVHRNHIDFTKNSSIENESTKQFFDKCLLNLEVSSFFFYYLEN